MTDKPQSRISNLITGLGRDIGIDLGTANTLVHVGGRGVLLREPSVVAINQDDGKVLAVGEEAKRMLGRTPSHIVATRPLRDGVIADFEQTEKMLQHFISKVSNRFLLRRTVVVGIPSGATEVERRAVLEASHNAGATKAYVVEEPMAAAFGAGLPVDEANASIIVDIGGGTTEVAVICLGGIVKSHSIRIAGDEVDECIVSHVRRAYNMAIGDRTAEQVKIDVGSAVPLHQELTTTIKGRDLITGLPRKAVLSSEEVRAAIQEPLSAIVEAVRLTLEETPPELAEDAMERGITVTGGGALLRGIDRLISKEATVPAHLAKDPLSSVVNGAGIMVEAVHGSARMRRMLERSSRP